MGAAVEDIIEGRGRAGRRRRTDGCREAYRGRAGQGCSAGQQLAASHWVVTLFRLALAVNVMPASPARAVLGGSGVAPRGPPARG